MMELADMRDLGSRAERRAGSTPVTRTSVGAKHTLLRRFLVEDEQIRADFIKEREFSGAR